MVLLNGIQHLNSSQKLLKSQAYGPNINNEPVDVVMAGLSKQLSQIVSCDSCVPFYMSRVVIFFKHCIPIQKKNKWLSVLASQVVRANHIEF